MTKSGFHRQLATTSLVVGPKRNSKALPKARLALKKVVGTVWWSAAGLILCSCLKPLHLRSAQQIVKMRWTKTATPAANIGHQKGSSSPWQRLTTHWHFKGWTNGLWSFASSALLNLLPKINYHIFKHPDNFLQGECFHNQQEAENAFQEFVKSWSTDFLHYKNELTYFLLAKTYWLSWFLFCLLKMCLSLFVVM